MTIKDRFTFFQVALGHHRAGWLKAAVKGYQRQLEQDPGFMPAWTNLAIALKQLHRLAEAERVCRQALQFDPHYAELWNNLGVILMEKRDFAGALAAYRRCVAEEPHHTLGWTNLATILVREGQVGEAIAALQHVLALGADHAVVHDVPQGVHTPHLIFTLTPGRSGTAFLAELLHNNVSGSEIYHEIIGFDTFGVDTPDLSHLTLFNARGNVLKVREFWKQKFDRILAKPVSVYGETSHILMKAGLVENLDLVAGRARVTLILLRRPMLELVASYFNRGDFLNIGNMWMWYLDPEYPKNMVSVAPFLPLGFNGLRLWYLYEIEARSVYYRAILANRVGVKVVEAQLHQLNRPEEVNQFLKELGVPLNPGSAIIPPARNVGNEHKKLENYEDLVQFIQQTPFDPVLIAHNKIMEQEKMGP